MNLFESYRALAGVVKAPIGIGLVVFAAAGLWSTAEATLPRGREVMLPMTCAELLPETEPFAAFFEAVARGSVTTNARLSKRMFRVLALRQKISENAKLNREDNPIDGLLRKTLCFFRESKEPVRPIPFDDAQFLKYMDASIDEVEKKSEEAVYEAELMRLQREEYVKRLDRNQELVESLRAEADRSAQKSYDQISQRAKKKAQSP